MARADSTVGRGETVLQARVIVRKLKPTHPRLSLLSQRSRSLTMFPYQFHNLEVHLVFGSRFHRSGCAVGVACSIAKAARSDLLAVQACW